MTRGNLELCTSLLQCVYELLDDGKFIDAYVNGENLGTTEGHAKIHLRHAEYNKLFNEDEYSVQDFDDCWRLSTFINGVEIVAIVDKE